MEDIKVQDVVDNYNNKEYIMKALEVKGEYLEFVSDELKDDKDIILLAVKKAPWTICYIS